MIVVDLGLTLLALDVIGDERHRTRTVKRAERVHVVEAGEPEIPAIARHAAFKLEDADRFAAVEHIEGGLIVDRDFLDVEAGHAAADQFLGIADHRESLQAEKIHLQHPEIGQRFHGILRDHLVLLAAREREDFRQITVADDHPRRVDARVARETLQNGRIAPELPRAGLGFDGLLEVRILLPRRLEGDVQLVRDHFGDAVAVAVTQSEHARHVAHHALGAELVEGDDLGNATLAVFLPDIFDDLAAAGLAEIDVDVGRTDPLGVEKALENEAVAHRVEVGDAEHVGHHAPGGRSASRTDGNAALLGEVDEVPDDEKVAGETELFEDAELVVQTLAQSRRPVAVAALETFLAKLAQVTLARPALRGMENRKARLAEFHADLAALGNARRVGQRLRMVAENLGHLLRRLEVKLRQVTQPPLVGHVGPRADADHHVMRFVVGALEEMDVVGRDQAETEVAGPAHQMGVDLALRVHPVIMNLDEEIPLPEDVAVLGGQPESALRIAVEDGAAHLAFQASAQPDEPLGVPGQKLLVDARLVVEPLEVRGADQLDQVGPPLVRLRQDRQVVGGVAAGRGLLLVHRTRGDIHLAAQERFDAGLLRLLVELHRPVKHPVVGHADRLHPGRRHPAHQVGNPHRPVEHRILRVHVKVGELGNSHGPRLNDADGVASWRPGRLFRMAKICGAATLRPHVLGRKHPRRPPQRF